MLLWSKPIYKLSDLIDYHFKQYEGEKSIFLKHIEFVILPLLEKIINNHCNGTSRVMTEDCPSYSIVAQIIRSWCNERAQNLSPEVKDAKSQTFDCDKIFISYSWDNDIQNNRILSFTNYLRENGYNAEVDLILNSQETAIDFKKMMHQGMTNYKKVIIVLSKGYKVKAESFMGGVGNEYRLILSDIEQNKNKYILVNLDKDYNIHEIAPLGFVGRYIIDLSKSENFDELFARLNNETAYEFSAVSPTKRTVQKKTIPSFNTSALDIVKLIANHGISSLTYDKYTRIDYSLELMLKNVANELISDYSIEITYPVCLKADIQGGSVVDNTHIIKICEEHPPIHSGQTRVVKLVQISLTNRNAKRLLKEKIIAKIYHSNNIIEKEFNLSDILFSKRTNAQDYRPLTIEDFY